MRHPIEAALAARLPKAGAAAATCGDRAVGPELTLRAVGRHMGAMGITRIANVTGLDRVGIPVAVACRPNSRSLSVSQGKGETLAAAKASALMESAEAFCAERIHAPLLAGSAEDLGRRVRLCGVERLPLAPGSDFAPWTRIAWIEGYDLLAGEPTWVPLEVVHTDYTLPRPLGRARFQASTNGLASGNNLPEAVRHALCELVERDAVSLWRAGGAALQEASRLDLPSVDDPRCAAALGRFEAAQVGIAAWEVTSDLQVPAYMCVAVDLRAEDCPVMATGAGCHPDPGTALLRALTEAAQSRLTGIAGTRDDITAAEYEANRDPAAAARQRGVLERQGPLRPWRARSCGGAADTIDGDVRWLLGRLAEAGIRQAVAVDLGRPEYGLAVARVVVPGLEPPVTAPGYCPGPRALAAAKSA